MSEFEQGNPLITIRERIGKVKETPEIVEFKTLSKDSINEAIDIEMAHPAEIMREMKRVRVMFAEFSIEPNSSILSPFDLLHMSQEVMRKGIMNMLEMDSELKKKHAGLLLDFEKGFNLSMVAILVSQGVSNIGDPEEGVHWGVSSYIEATHEDLKSDFEMDGTGRTLIRKQLQKIKNPSPRNGYIERYEDRDMVTWGADCSANAYSKLYPLAEKVMAEH